MAFPTSPTNGQTAVINNTSYTYNAAQGTWAATQAGVSTPITIAANTSATSTTTGALQVVGGIGVQGNVYAANVGFADGTVFNTVQSFGSRNRIINGDFKIDQRSGGANVAVSTGTAAYYIDRWIWNVSGSNTQSKGYTGLNQGSIPSPTGFFSYYGWTTTAVPSTLTSGDYLFLSQKVEGYFARDLGWGQTWARNATLSFWTRSSNAGVYSGFIRNNPNFNNSLSFTYNIPSPNTWTYVSIPVQAPTSGTWGGGSGVGLELGFAIWNGSTYAPATSNTWTTGNYTGANSLALSGNVLTTVGSTIQWTGVQLEPGNVPTPYEYRHYTAELQLCQRYYYATANTSVSGNNKDWMWITYTSNGDTRGRVPHPTTMRAAPSVSFSTTSWNMIGVGVSGTANNSPGSAYGPVNISMTSITASAITVDSWSINTASISGWGSMVVWGSNQGLVVYADADM
jgi:hypothetical protein